MKNKKAKLGKYRMNSYTITYTTIDGLVMELVITIPTVLGLEVHQINSQDLLEETHKNLPCFIFRMKRKVNQYVVTVQQRAILDSAILAAQE